MHVQIRPFGCGLVFALLFLGFGVGCCWMGIDATIHRWAATGRGNVKTGYSTTVQSNSDRTRLYGPGIVVGGLSVAAAGALVVPSLWIMEQNRYGTHRWWPRVVLLWRIVGIGIVTGFSLAILAAIINQFL